MKRARIQISGMHCASCASNIERSLKKVKGVKKANVILLLKKCIVECEDNVNAEDLQRAIRRTGYQPGDITFE